MLHRKLSLDSWKCTVIVCPRDSTAIIIETVNKAISSGTRDMGNARYVG
ncbi:hypothetical protein MHH52_23705 [Paenibacillus sp. FSL K6-0276]